MNSVGRTKGGHRPCVLSSRWGVCLERSQLLREAWRSVVGCGTGRGVALVIRP